MVRKFNIIIIGIVLVSLGLAANAETTKIVTKTGNTNQVVIRNQSNFFKHRKVFDCSKQMLCQYMESCSEAKFYLKKCGASLLDGDNDGIPCEGLCK